MNSGSVAVVGDVMLDVFTHGSVNRMSSEAAVPVLEVTREQYMPGGAGNVARNLVSLGVDAQLFAVVGDGFFAKQLDRALCKAGIGTLHVIADESRPTTTKQRFLGPKGQVFCVDRQKRDLIATPIMQQLLRWLAEQPWSAIIVSDYDRGVVSPTLLHGVITVGNQQGIPVLVDTRPRRLSWYQRHAQGCTLLTPNRGEAEFMINMQRPMRTKEEVLAAARMIAEAIGCSVLLKLDREGMLFVQNDGCSLRATMLDCVNVTPAVEVSGAGDTVIATIAAQLIRGKALLEAALIAAAAAAVAVSKPGTAIVTQEEIDRHMALCRDAARELGRRPIAPETAPTDGAVSAPQEQESDSAPKDPGTETLVH